MLNKLQIYLFAALIFTLPFDIKTLIYQTEWYGGLFNPYASVSISLSELLLYINSIIFLIKSFVGGKKIHTGDKSFFFIFILLEFTAVLSLLLSDKEDSILKFLTSLKVFDMLIFYILAVNQVLKITRMMKIFIMSMGLQAIIGIAQFILQSDLGLGILGEQDLNRFNPQAAKFYIENMPILRAYGTFAHPNIFSAYLLTSIMFIFIFWKKMKPIHKYILIILQVVALLLTFSRSTLFAFIVAVVILSSWHLKSLDIRRRFKVLFISLIVLSQLFILWIYRILSIFTDNSISERIEGYKNALKMFWDYPTGVGFNLSTLYLDKISDKNIPPWTYQPPHNIYLLILSEAGLLGATVLFSILGFLIYKLIMKNKNLMNIKERHIWRVFCCLLVSFVIITLFDHYFFTLEKGRYISILNFSIFTVFLSSKGNIFPIKKGG